jgi:drug/metabolite transporter (DMT)-like permease
MRLLATLLAIAGLVLIQNALGWQAWGGVTLIWAAAVLYASESPSKGSKA